ncbi:MAG: LysE family translocator [Verrucomicrobiota bacterium]
MNGELLAFAGIMALGQFSPGPDMILLTRTALKSGAWAGVEMALGIACGLAVHATVAVGGLALAFDRLPMLRRVMGWMAAGYLLWLAYRIFTEVFAGRYSGGKGEADMSIPTHRPFLRGLLCNLLNPKAAIILAALSAPFLRGDRPDWWPLAVWGIIVGQGGVLWSMWAGLLQWPPLRKGYGRSSRWIDGAFAIVLAALAVRLMAG